MERCDLEHGILGLAGLISQTKLQIACTTGGVPNMIVCVQSCSNSDFLWRSASCCVECASLLRLFMIAILSNSFPCSICQQQAMYRCGRLPTAKLVLSRIEPTTGLEVSTEISSSLLRSTAYNHGGIIVFHRFSALSAKVFGRVWWWAL